MRLFPVTLISSSFTLFLLFGLISFVHETLGDEGTNVDGSPANGITNFANVLCGRQLTRKPKVVGGTESYQGEFPWLVSIKERIAGQFYHICGGFILNNRYVISAAHCFEKFNYDGKIVRLDRLRITMGEHDLTQPELPINAIDVGVESLTLHPAFDIYGYINDIAVLKLTTEIGWNPYTWPACVSNQEFKTEGKNSTVAGWGSLVDINDDQMGEYPSILQKTVLPVLSNSECQKWFHRKSVHWNPRSSHLCAGYPNGGMDACRGDSGGPLMVKDGEELVVVGIVAAGKGCARPSLPGVYTRISSYMDWIQDQIQSDS